MNRYQLLEQKCWSKKGKEYEKNEMNVKDRDEVVVPNAFLSLIKQCWQQDRSKRPTFSKVIELIESRSGGDM